MAFSTDNNVSSLLSTTTTPPTISVPVYSLATTFKRATDIDLNSKPSMNIVTFATPVSVNPRLYMISLYHGTMTRDAFLSNKYAILQLLDKKQKDLVPILGKRSGYDYKQGYDKQIECSERAYPWIKLDVGERQWNADLGGDAKKAFQGMKLLPDCQSYIQLELMDTMEAGDHEMVLCRVLGIGKWDAERLSVVDAAADDSDDANNDGGTVTSMPAKGDKNKDSILYTGYLRKIQIL